MKNTQVEFNKVGVIAPFVLLVAFEIFILFFAVPYCIIHQNENIHLIIPAIILGIGIFLFYMPLTYFHIKAFKLYLKKIPPIELTTELYISNIENIQLSWNEIAQISIREVKRGSYNCLALKVFDDSVVYNQAKNILWKIIFWQSLRKNSGFAVLPFNLLNLSRYKIVELLNNYREQKAGN